MSRIFLFCIFLVGATTSVAKKNPFHAALSSSGDISASKAAEIARAGFAVVRLSPHDKATAQDMFQHTRSKLYLGSEFSARERMSNPFGGCYHLGGETTAVVGDARKGCYHLDPIPGEDSPLVNATQPHISPELRSRYKEMTLRHTNRVLRGICRALYLADSCMDSLVATPYTQTLIAYYPFFGNSNATTVEVKASDDQYTGESNVTIDTATPLGMHTDYGFTATVYQPQEAGLEVRIRDGSMMPVPQDSGKLILLLGRTLELVTGGFAYAIPHRVTRVQGERYSITVFANPSLGTTVKPLMLCQHNGDRCFERPECKGEQGTALASCGVGAGFPVQSFCWEDYEVYTWCRMFAHRWVPSCDTVSVHSSLNYSDIHFAGREDCSEPRRLTAREYATTIQM